jgi:hypothetical protein
VKTFRTILATAVLLAVATAMLVIGASSAASAWDTSYTIGQGGAHCDATNGNHWAWNPNVSPGDAANLASISAPGWTEQNRSVNAQNKLILHYVSTEPMSGPQELIIDGESYSVDVVFHVTDKCPGEVPPPPPETCETNPDLCPPPPPPPAELVSVCRDGQIIEIPKEEVLPTDTEKCETIVPPEVPEVPVTPEVPKVPEVVPPAVVTHPVPLAPVVPVTPTVDTPKELAFTGTAQTAGLTTIGTVLLIAGLLMLRGRKTQRGLVR